MQTDNEDVVIEVVDDASLIPSDPLRDPLAPKPAVQAETPAPKEEKEGDDDDDNLDEYGERVRKRISKEVWKRREVERKLNELAERNAALERAFAQTQQSATASADYAVQAREEAIKAEYERVQSAYKQAYDQGDTDAIFAATERLADIKLQARQIEGWKQQRAARPQPQYQQPVAQPQQQGPDPRALDWASRNDWFGQDAAKTGAAYAIDAQLKSEGIDPRSEEYYEELDKRLSDNFPSLRKAPAAPKPSQPVAGVSRGTTEKRKVQLSAAEVQMAQKLGVPLAEYARYKKG